MDKKELNEDELAKKLFKKLPREKTSADFTVHVMDKITALEARKKQVLEYKPIINLKGWLLVAASVAVLIIFIALTGNNTVADTPYAGYIEKGNGFLNKLITGIEISPIILMIIFAFWGLFIIDKIMSSKLYNKQ